MFDAGAAPPPWANTAGLYRPRRSDGRTGLLRASLTAIAGAAAGAFGGDRRLSHAAQTWARVMEEAAPPASVAAASDLLKGRAVDLGDPAARRIAIALAAATMVLARGRVHVACFTEGLAASAHQAARPFFDELGLGHAIIGKRDDLAARRAAYGAAIVYVAARRLAQDALLDAETLKGAVTSDRARVRRLAASGDEAAPVLGPGAATVLVDDADLILLGAGAPASLGADAADADGRRLAGEAFAIISALRQPRHYDIDPITRRIRLTEAGVERAASFAVAFGGPWSASSWREETVIAALAIRDLYEFGRNYSLEDGRIVLAGGGAPEAATPSIPDLIAAKEGLETTSPGARQVSLPRFFGRYLHLGAAGIDLWTARRELKETVGLGVRRHCKGLPERRVETFADFAGKMARLQHLVEDGWSLWAPTEADAQPLKDLGGEISIGAALMEAPQSDRKFLQAAAAAPQVEMRFALQHPQGGAVVSAEDQYFEPLETPLLDRIRDGESAMTQASYQKLQALREDYAAEQRAKQARADAYFDAVMAFAGDDI